jgi:hypothetical protein
MGGRYAPHIRENVIICPNKLSIWSNPKEIKSLLPSQQLKDRYLVPILISRRRSSIPLLRPLFESPHRVRLHRVRDLCFIPSMFTVRSLFVVELDASYPGPT